MLKKTIIYILTIIIITSCSGNQVSLDTHKVTKTLDTNVIKKEPEIKVQEFEDKYVFYKRLLHTLKPQDYNFNSIIKLYNGYVEDTITKFKNKNSIRINLRYDYGIDLYVNGLNKLKEIDYNDLSFDSVSVFKYYHSDPANIKDDK